MTRLLLVVGFALAAAAAAIALGYVLGRGRRRRGDLMAVADAVRLPPIVDPSPDVYAAPRLVLAQADVDARFAELTAGWAPKPERRRPPISPGPSFVEES